MGFRARVPGCMSVLPLEKFRPIPARGGWWSIRCVLGCLLLLGLGGGVASLSAAEDPDSAFLRAYTEFQAAERLEQSGDTNQALSKYRFAASLLEQIARNSPEWQPMIVQYRLRKITEALGRLESLPPSTGGGGGGADGGYFEGELPAFDSSPRAPQRVMPPGVSVNPGFSPPVEATLPPASSGTRATSPSLERELAALRRDNQILREQLAQRTAELKSSRHEVDKTLVTVVELRHELMQAKTRLEDVLKEQGTVAKVREQYTKQIEEIASEYEKTRAERMVLEEENERLQQKLEQAAQYIASSDEIRQNLETERETFYQDREAARADRDKVQSELQTTLAELESSRARLTELESLAAENQTLRSEKQTLQEQLALAEARAEELLKASKVLEEKLQTATSPEALAEIKAAHAEAMSRKDAALAELAEKEKVLLVEIELLKKADSRQEPLQQQLSELTERLAKAETERENLRKELAARVEQPAATEPDPQAEEKLRGLEEKLAAAEAEKTALEQEKTSLQQQLADLANAGNVSEALTAELATAREELARLAKAGEEQAALSEKLQQAEARIGELESDLAARDESLQNLQSELHSVNDRLFALRGELASRENRIQALEKQLDETAAELAELRLNPKPSPEEQQARLETEVLRGILLRQLREQARRDQARRLIEEEINALQVQSTTLQENLTVLGQGIELTEEEKVLFRLPVADVEADSPESLSATISITKPSPQGTAPPAKPLGITDLTPEQQEQARKAQAALREGKIAEAEPIWMKLAEESPNNFFVLSQLAATQVQGGKTRAARVALDKAMELKPDDAFTHAVQGVVLFRQGDLAGAEKSLRRAIELDPSLARPYNHLGIVVSQKGDFAEAEELLKKAIAVDPKYAEAQFNLAVLYATAQPPRKEEAAKAYQAALDLGARGDAALERLLR